MAPNSLASETSPYLLQHADNPVDWLPWSDEAFDLARKLDRPVFLSIGYSTCHWCHVMAHESFEDEQTASVLNEVFVCIKVDREERPDVDGIYMQACQMLTGSGGWPLTLFLTPDRKPFFAATYIPKRTAFGRVGLTDLVRKVQEIWADKRAETIASAARISQALAEQSAAPPRRQLDEEILNQARDQLASRYDRRHGGFGPAPKFPSPHQLVFLLDRHWRTGNPDDRDMVVHTLTMMRCGGLFDQIGYGFHRYSTDAQWLLPHFEKMLYDQAMLTLAYVEAYQLTGDPLLAQTADQILTYVRRDLAAPEGGFYSAEDADSEGEEGKFYIWSARELEEALGPELFESAKKWYRIKPGGNFREEATGQLTGDNILHLSRPPERLAQDEETSPEEFEQRLAEINRRLFEQRQDRIRPHRDEKILVDWNGLMIAALARAGRVLDRADYLDAARETAEFIASAFRSPQGRLRRRPGADGADVPAVADDYAFLILGLLEIYEAAFDPADLGLAVELQELMIDLYWDDRAGGFFHSSADRTDLLIRRKEIYDGALPSANSVSLVNLLLLYRLTGRPDFHDRAQTLSRTFSGSVAELPSAYCFFLLGLDRALKPGPDLVIVQAGDPAGAAALLAAARQTSRPDLAVMIKTEDNAAALARLAPFTAEYQPPPGRATAYLCQNQTCLPPLVDPAELAATLARPDQTTDRPGQATDSEAEERAAAPDHPPVED